MPDNLVELEQKPAITLDGQSVGSSPQRHGMRFEVAARLIGSLDERHEEITHLSDAVLCCFDCLLAAGCVHRRPDVPPLRAEVERYLRILTLPRS